MYVCVCVFFYVCMYVYVCVYLFFLPAAHFFNGSLPLSLYNILYFLARIQTSILILISFVVEYSDYFLFQTDHEVWKTWWTNDVMCLISIRKLRRLFFIVSTQIARTSLKKIIGYDLFIKSVVRFKFKQF